MDPWDIIAVPFYWAYIGVLEARERIIRLNSKRRESKSSQERKL